MVLSVGRIGGEFLQLRQAIRGWLKRRGSKPQGFIIDDKVWLVRISDFLVKRHKQIISGWVSERIQDLTVLVQTSWRQLWNLGWCKAGRHHQNKKRILRKTLMTTDAEPGWNTFIQSTCKACGEQITRNSSCVMRIDLPEEDQQGTRWLWVPSVTLAMEKASTCCSVGEKDPFQSKTITS